MGPQFHESVYGRNFFEYQLPNLIEAINRMAEALGKNESSLQLARCVDDGIFDGKLLFQKGRMYILALAENGYYDVFDRETGAKVECTRLDLERHFDLKS